MRYILAQSDLDTNRVGPRILLSLHKSERISIACGSGLGAKQFAQKLREHIGGTVYPNSRVIEDGQLLPWLTVVQWLPSGAMDLVVIVLDGGINVPLFGALEYFGMQLIQSGDENLYLLNPRMNVAGVI